MGLERRRDDFLVQQAVGVVFAPFQLGNDDRSLRFAVVLVVQAPSHPLGLDEQHAVERIARGCFEVGGLVEPGVPVLRPAELLDDPLHLVAWDVGSALEIHVLHSVRHTGEARQFVTRADLGPAPHRHERRGVLSERQHLQPVLEQFGPQGSRPSSF